MGENNIELSSDFEGLKTDLKRARKQAIKKKELLEYPDYARYCKLEYHALLKELFNYAAGQHTWLTFQSAVCKFNGTFVEFMDSDHWEDPVV